MPLTASLSMNRAGCGSQTRGPDRASLRRSGSWSHCATEKSWRLPMNQPPYPVPLPLRGGEGARRAGEGDVHSSDERLENRGALHEPGRASVLASPDFRAFVLFFSAGRRILKALRDFMHRSKTSAGLLMYRM